MPASHDAFISYSHQADAALAPVLERGIERLARATFQLRAIDVFRDQTSLSASPGVWTGIREHLAGSRWFIFLASPKAAASPWCGKELHWWLEERGTAQLLIVLTDGTIEWDGAGGDFDWTRTDALPRDAMAGRFGEVPLYVDLRWTRDAGPLSARDPRLRGAYLDLAAPVRGVAKDQLDGEDVRHLRRTRVLARSALATILVAAALAIWQAVEANRQRAQAESERELAVSRQLAAQATEMRVREPVLALLLAAQARAVAPTPETTSVLLALARTMPLDRIVEHDARFSSVAARPGSDDAWIGDSEGSVWRLGLVDGRWSRVHNGSGTIMSGPAAHAVSDDGRTVAFGGYGGTISLWRDGRVDALPSPIDREQIILDLAFSPDGRRLAAAGQTLSDSLSGNGFVVLYDLGGSPPQVIEANSGAARLHFTPDNRRLVVGGDGGFLKLLPLEKRDKPPVLSASRSGSVTDFAFADGGRRLFVAWSLGQIDVIDIEQGRRVDWFLAISNGLLEGMVVAADGRTVYTTHADGAVVRWVRDRNIQRWDSTELYRHATAPAGITLLDAGTRIASVDRDGRIFVARDLHVTAPSRVRWQGSEPFQDAWLDQVTRRVGIRTAAGAGWFVPEAGRFEAASARDPGRTLDPVARTDARTWETLARHGEQVVRRRGADVVWTAGSDRALPGGQAITAAAFAPDGQMLYTLAGNQVQAWQGSSGSSRGQPVAIGQNASRLITSPDGRWLVVLHAAPMQIGKLERGVRHPALSVLALPELNVRVQTAELALEGSFGMSALFTPDGRDLLLLDGSTLNLWDMAAMRRVETAVPLGNVKVLGWIQDRWPLWLADQERGQLLTLDLRGEALADWACALAGRALTPAEWVRFLGSGRVYAPRCPERP